MKGKMGITKKLFLITSIVFIVFIAGTLIIQSLFFEKFYIYKKKGDLINSVEKFKVEYNKTADEYAGDLIGKYEMNNNIKIMILDSSNRLKFVTMQSLGKPDIGRTRELAAFIQSWAETPGNVSLLKRKEQTILISPDSFDDPSRNLIAVSSDTKRSEVIFALSSLQPVSEAVGVIEKLYLYFCIGAVFFTFLLALIYSNMIAKPLVRINRVATKMAKLDFSEKCEVRNQDEIGNVASSLNFLSENLNDALTSLRQANAKLEEDIEKERKLEKMRREFVAAVSHELKTPISLIDGYAMGLKDNIFEEEDRDYYLDIIIDESEKMANLVSDMLDLSHLESGIFKLKKEELNITELIIFTLKKYEAVLNEKSLKVELNLIDGVKAFGDWNRLEQVMTNFLTNAIRHVNEGGTVLIEMIDCGDSISIEVENTGSNIPEDEMTKIWDRFYKIDKSRNRSLGGTGIGLSIVKNILSLHEYPFGVKNTERGVRFYFKVPKL